ncbi:hypothetical protein FN846DRAFT_966182 [Sphaerosporella brunnea]|uniref:Zn(2)-C6 fungal-type domain-containing protein n=1 Tax=Sphaerosporella brunnea TaxID=1250544 RepID=A0A5J5ELQ9_9PEZI|nr:hypothetical protein FN846DRAFT_966182 [Sphaerosporella brunnea]
MSSAASTPSTPPATTTTATTRKACDSCRASKARCEPEPEDASGACQRCRKTGRICIFGERSRRRKRLKVESGDEGEHARSGGAPTEESKVERLERKVCFLEARLGVMADRGEREDGYRTPPPTTTPSSTTPERPTQTNLPPLSLTNPMYYFSLADLRSQPRPKTAAAPDVVSRGVLTLTRATALYSHFVKSMLPHFPFIEPTSVERCREELPTLFLAILAASAASLGHAELHSNLLEEVYNVLASRILVSCEKGLELVQAILTVVTWYTPPGCFTQSRLWMLTMQAGTMAIEIGLGTSSDTTGVDGARALLVCYGCNASISVVVKRPVFLRWGKRIETALARVKKSNQKADRVVALYVQLVRHVEEAAGAAGVLEGDSVSIGAASLAWVLDTCQRRVNETLAADRKDSEGKSHDWGITSTSVEIARTGAVLQAFSLLLDRNESPLLMAANARLLVTAHRTLELFMAAPTEVLRCSPFHVFSRTANACSVLLRFATREKSKGSSLVPLRVLHYYEATISCLRQLLSKGTNRGFHMCLGLIDSMRAYYCNNIEAPPPPPQQQQHEEDAVAAASILCGGPSSSYTAPRFSEGFAMPTPPDQQMFPPPPPPSQMLQQQQQQQQMQFEPMDVSQQDLGAFLSSIEGQVMMGFEFDGCGGGWPAQWGCVGEGESEYATWA